jgi:hypothetical protein
MVDCSRLVQKCKTFAQNTVTVVSPIKGRGKRFFWEIQMIHSNFSVSSSPSGYRQWPDAKIKKNGFRIGSPVAGWV